MLIFQKIYSATKAVLPSAIRHLLKRFYQSKIRKQCPYSNNYSYQSNYMHHVPEQGIVLDIASGHNPFPKATILSRSFLEITAHRREEIVLDHRPFVMLDIHHLPFVDKSIDYIYCSHVIEHVEDPLQACSEMMRVGKR